MKEFSVMQPVPVKSGIQDMGSNQEQASDKQVFGYPVRSSTIGEVY